MRKNHPIIFFIFFLSGAAGLTYEVVWARMLTVVFGSSILVVSAVLTSFMAGLALGSFYFGHIAERVKNPLRLYAWLEIGTGISALLLIPIFACLDNAYIFMYGYMREDVYFLPYQNSFSVF